jgi:rRNA maturation protein Rpf1
MSSLLRATLITLALLTTAGCTNKPVLNTQHELPANAQVSDEQMKQVIINALAKREWTVQRLSPQLIQAEITVRNQFHAEIDIRYTRNSYAITYRDSRDLGYKDGTIHRNYNRWVSMLDRDILAGLRSTDGQ